MVTQKSSTWAHIKIHPKHTLNEKKNQLSRDIEIEPPQSFQNMCEMLVNCITRITKKDKKKTKNKTNVMTGCLSRLDI